MRARLPTAVVRHIRCLYTLLEHAFPYPGNMAVYRLHFNTTGKWGLSLTLKHRSKDLNVHLALWCLECSHKCAAFPLTF